MMLAFTVGMLEMAGFSVTNVAEGYSPKKDSFAILSDEFFVKNHYK
ncbi:MAG: hypothetical protein WCR52_03435 [Bacteroidota bacterium]